MKTELTIEGMSCEHCVKHVSEALEALNGVTSVKVSLEGKNAVILHDGAINFEIFKAAVTEAGYEVISIGPR